jgi:exo-beta-1,3-glucanase (GH17 family)
MNRTAEEILSNTDYLAISYGGYRENTRDVQPSVEQVKEDMLILAAMGVRILRDYNVQLQHATTLLEAIKQLKEQDGSFEMYVMLGAWIDCQNAWTDLEPNHEVESAQANASEIQRAIDLANTYPDIVKIIAVGNEAMVTWATSYFVRPNVILKWVNHLQDMKKSGDLPADLWITSSDDFSSWGGGDPSYQTEDLENLIRAVDYVSMHTYPMHNSHYNPEFWIVPAHEQELSEKQKIKAAMIRAKQFVVDQFQSTLDYMHSIGVDKPLHIGETGWATVCVEDYGANGSKAADQYKSGIYYQHMREWSKENNISCFYFEAFDECWKDQNNEAGSENHFGLINLQGEAKYALWDMVDEGVFEGLTRDGNPITKTFNGDKEVLMKDALAPPTHY